MSRYTDVVTIKGSPHDLFESVRQLLEEWGYDIMFLGQDCLMAREKVGHVPLALLATVELTVDSATTAEGSPRIRVVVKNEAMPLQSNNYCFQIFQRLSQALASYGEKVNGVSAAPRPTAQTAPQTQRKESAENSQLKGESGWKPPQENKGKGLVSNVYKLPNPAPHDQNGNIDELEMMTLGELTQVVDQLQHSMEQLGCLVNEQEEELALHRQQAEALQRQRNASDLFSDLDLEREIAEEQELAKMLDESLAGQRSRLREQKIVFHRYLSVLRAKEAKALSQQD